MMFFFLTFKPVPGAQVSWLANLAAVAAGGYLRISLRDRLLPHRGADRQLFESCLGHDDRHAHGNLRDLSGERMDGARLRRPGHHHRRRGVHRGRQCGRYLAGSQDRLPDRRDSAQAADRVGDRRLRLDAGHRSDVAVDEPGAGGVPADREAVGYRRSLTAGCRSRSSTFTRRRSG